MKRSKDGFFLVEWMVHFLLLTIIALLSYSLIASWYRTVGQMNRLCNELLPVYIATDILRSDIHEAKDVKADNDNRLHMAHEYRSITWYCKDNKLLRSISSYDKKEQRWLKPSYGLLAQHITGFASRLLTGVEQITVNVKTERGTGAILLVASLRNGLIL